ncbi:MAG: cell division protein FtsW [Peptococcaceae bacterium]|nr:cell division protein FtsW [Peptococcaceae bacterium]
MAQKTKAGKPDLILLFATVFLLAIGLIMVLSASSLFSFRQTDNSYFLFFKQLRWACIGSIAAFITLLVPYRYWKRVSGLGVIVSIVLLLMLRFSSLAVTEKGSTRWLDIMGVSIQPSEIAKFALVLFLAYIFYRYPVRKLTDCLLPLAVVGVILLLVYKQPDLGTTIVIILACGAMFLITKLNILYFLTAAPILGAIGFYLIRQEKYQWNRILGWLYPWEYATSHGWQGVNAQIAFGTGGLFGIGIGRSATYGSLPENYTDTIYAVIGQEFGFFGTFIVLVGFVVLIGRGYFIARQCPEPFGRLLGFGITTMLAVQIAVNLCVVTGLLPITGITLPLISYGGSSLLITMIEIGILLNISRYRQVTIETKLKSHNGNKFKSQGAGMY